MGKNRFSLESNIEKIRADFPILSTRMGDNPLVYLDNAASTQKPASVMECERLFLCEGYSNIKRGAHKLGTDATIRYEGVRSLVADFIGTDNPNEVIFTSGTTQSVNLVARSFGSRFLKSGDEVIISIMEHHSNIVPWQIMCEELGIVLKVIPVNDYGELIMEEYEKLLSKKTKLVSVTHVSNVLGTVNPIKEIIEKAHIVGAKVLIDGAQSIPHMKIDVKDLDCDFFVFSGHKMFAPTGVGILYGKMEILEELPPFITGGGMIMSVTFKKTTFAKPPAKFEAGTPPISQVIGLGEAVNYLNKIGMENIKNYEKSLLDYGTHLLEDIKGLKQIGEAKGKTSIFSFFIDNLHPHDAITILDRDGIAVRGGHHCAQPLMDRFNVPATIRASLAFYNTKEELEKLVESLRKAIEVFKCQI